MLVAGIGLASSLPVPAARAQSSGSAAPVALQITSSAANGQWLRRTDRIDLVLNRPTDPVRERLAVVIGTTDWTALFERAGETLSYRGGPVPLPAGESALTVYTVSPEDEWQQVGQLSIRVLTPAGFEKAEAKPKVDVSSQGQVFEGHTPASNAPARARFQDGALNLGLRTAHVRGGMTTSTQVNVLGTSNQPQALRFADLGAEAPRVDLADYLVGLEGRRGTIQAGHLAFTLHRHLVTGGGGAPGVVTAATSSFASRGLTGMLRLPRLELTVAAMNGTAIVGVDNLFGVSNRDHQLVVANVATDFVADRPGGVRLQFTVVDGSRLPQSAFAQGQVNDAERSRGAGLRFVASDRRQRLRLDLGTARSRFSNPADPLVSGSLALEPVVETTNDAHYVDASFDFVKDAQTRSGVATLTGTYRFERVDPLYRTVSATQPVRADVLLHTVEVTGGIGRLVGQVSESRSQDNLGRVASILTTDTRITTATLALPLGSLGAGQTPSPWLPLVSYALNRTAQVGQGVPANGGFANASQVPDQANVNHALRADWSGARARAAYVFNYTLVDNRQEGRATADFESLVQQVTLGLGSGTKADLSLDLGNERATNRELGQVRRTWRAGLNGTWRMTTFSTLTGLVGHTVGRDPQAGRDTAVDLSVQFAQTIPLRRGGPWTPRAQLFAGWTWRSAETQPLLAGLVEPRHNWSINTGLTLSLF